MVFLTLSRKINKVIGPFLLRNGVNLRHALARGGVVKDNALLDNMLLIKWSQKIVSLEVHDEALKLVAESKGLQMGKWADDMFDQIFGTDAEEARRKNMTPSELRLLVLESFLRPALLKNEQWGDVAKWQFNRHFMKWARAEFLLAKHGIAVQDALTTYPKLRQSPQLAINPMRRGVLKLVHGGSEVPETPKQMALPSASLVEKAFHMKDWSRKKDPNASKQYLDRVAAKLGGSIIDLRGGSMRFANIPSDADVSKVSLEDVLELAGGHVAHCGPFNALCEERDIYQFWTREYVDLLANYILKQTNDFKGETVVIDLGAGDGLLTKNIEMSISKEIRGEATSNFVKRKGRQHRSNAPASPAVSQQNQYTKVPAIIAVDDGSWSIYQKASVEKMGVEEALATYCSNDDDDRTSKQVIVLCSWMPMGVDWSALFRQFNVDEYILIGECDDGSCGDNWETWGSHSFLTDDIEEAFEEEGGSPVESESASPTPRPFEMDGYKRIDIDDLVAYQFSRFDSAMSKTGRTVTFRRHKQ